MSDCDNHGISKENVKALCNDGFGASHITQIYVDTYFFKEQIFNIKFNEIRHILKSLHIALWYLILWSHLEHKRYLIEFISLKFQLFPK